MAESTPPPDATALARRGAGTVPDGEPLYQHRGRGLDHGAWGPLMAMYPLADIPVLQLSMPTQDPARTLELGARLASLREEGILVVGSGFMTHGLPFITPAMFHGEVPGWSSDFDAWAADALARGDVDELAAFKDRAPGMPSSGDERALDARRGRRGGGVDPRHLSWEGGAAL